MFNNTFREKHGFYGGHFEIGYNDQLLDESSIGNLILTKDVSEPNGTAHGDFCAKRTCCPKLYAKLKKKN